MPRSAQLEKVSAPDVQALRAMAAAVVQAAAPQPQPSGYRPRFLPSPPLAALPVEAPPPPAVAAPLVAAAPPPVTPPPAAAPPPPVMAPPPVALMTPPPTASATPAAVPVVPRRGGPFTRRSGTFLAIGLAAAAVALVTMRSKPSGPPQHPPLLASVRLPAPAPAPVAMAAPAPPPAAAAPAPEPASAPEEAPPEPVAKKTAERPHPALVRTVRSARKRAAAPRTAPAPAPAATATAAPAPGGVVSAGTESQLDQLVQAALAGKEKRGESHTQEPESAPSLTRDDIQASMKPLRPKIKECYKQFGQRGLALVNVKVGDKGEVVGTRVEGTFANSPTGACVESAVKSVRFPQSAGMSFRYPFPVR